MYGCARCGKTVLICSYCDRGQIYCADGCARQARRESLQRAGATYQGTFAGRRKHAARQMNYRRKKQEVTHQGPRPTGNFLDLLPAAIPNPPAQEEPDVPDRSVSPLPLASVPSLEAQARPSPSPSQEATEHARADSHVCHFCRCIQSQYVRRDTLCHLRRRKRHRRAGRTGNRGAG
jgi:hypothetical protein